VFDPEKQERYSKAQGDELDGVCSEYFHGGPIRLFSFQIGSAVEI
jgi:hypothetical protein